MKLPPTLLFGPHHVEVIYDAVLEDKGEPVDGLCNVADGKLSIRDGLRPTYHAEVLIHEVLHGVAFSTGVFPDEDAEERAVTVLANTLTRFARDNPEAIRAWLALALQ